jgi:long-chain acyl-CoA synthetase
MNEQKPINELTIPQMLEQSRKMFGSRVAMRYFDGNRFREITYDGFHLMIRQAVSMLKKAGIGPADKVAILSENRPEWGAAYFAPLYLDAINVPLDALLKIQEWSYILRNSGAKVIVTSNKFYPEIEHLVDEIDSLKAVLCMDRVNDVCYLLGDPDPPNIMPPDASIDDLAAILYTSGTTGLAKGVMLSHGNITSDIYGMTQYMELFPEDNFLSVLPLHHTFECTCGFLTPLSHGSSITYARGLASKLIVEDIKNNQTTILLAVPLLFEKMYASITRKISERPPFTRAIFKTIYGVSKFLKKAVNLEAGSALFKGLRDKAGLSTVRIFCSGGAPLSAEIAETFNTMGFRMIQGYGLTESSPVLTLNPLERYNNASIGVAMPGAEIRISKPDANGVGEIIARGPMVMKGYYKNEKATAGTIKDGWLYTGDLGRVDNDGYFYITGRKKNVIVTPGGKNVYPEEIELALNNSPFILESLVLGRPLPHGGEEIEAILVPDLEYFGARAEEKGITLHESHIAKTIKLEVAKQCEPLADYKRVKYVVIRDEGFEKTSTRKIKRYLYEHKVMTVPGSKNKEK